MKRVIVLVVLMLVIGKLWSQCTQVGEDGSVTIISTAYSDAVIDKKIGTDFVQIGSLSHGIYVDMTSDATNSQITYRLQVNNKEFSTIFLSGNTDWNNQVNLSWLCESQYTTFEVYSKSSTQTDWHLVAQINDLTQFSEPRPSVCQVQYYVKAIRDDCYSTSNIITLNKSDNQEPQAPILERVSVNMQSQQIVISWTESESQDTWGYVICKQDTNNTRVALDTIYGRENTSYTCSSCDVTDTNYFTVFAFDSCMNTSALSETFNNIVLTARKTSCDAPVQLSWISSTMDERLHRYDVFMVYGNVSHAMQSNLTQTYCEQTLPAYNGVISFYVIEDGDINHLSPYSNLASVNSDNSDTLEYIYLPSVSITQDNLHTLIDVYLDYSKNIKECYLYRQMDDNAFEKIKTIDFSQMNYHFQIEDTLPLSANEHLYTYFLAATDVCAISLTYSDTVSATKLNVQLLENEKVRLTWNKCSDKISNPTYEVYWFNEGEYDNPTLLTTTSSLSYIDDVSKEVSSTDRRFYVVKLNGQYTPNNVSLQANSCNNYALFESIFFVPNAFAPKDGVNERVKLFKPECHFVRQGTYSMKIYNRFGTLLFETSDTEQGWDGKYKDEFCPVGVYVYKISFTDSDAVQHNKKGTFLLYD